MHCEAYSQYGVYRHSRGIFILIVQKLQISDVGGDVSQVSMYGVRPACTFCKNKRRGAFF
jgi:hypothetical protein